MKAYLNPPAGSLDALQKALADWGLEDDNEELWEAWKMFDRTGGAVLPEAGGWLDQSLIIRKFIDAMYLLKAFHTTPTTPTPKLGNTW